MKIYFILVAIIFLITLLLSIFVISREKNKINIYIFYTIQIFLLLINFKLMKKALGVLDNTKGELVLYIIYSIVVLIHGIINKSKKLND